MGTRRGDIVGDIFWWGRLQDDKNVVLRQECRAASKMSSLETPLKLGSREKRAQGPAGFKRLGQTYLRGEGHFRRHRTLNRMFYERHWHEICLSCLCKRRVFSVQRRKRRFHDFSEQVKLFF